MKKVQLNIEELKWEDVQQDIKRANPKLAAILEQFQPKYNFIKARYFFGDRILNQGVTHLPVVGDGTIPLNSDAVPERIQKILNYSYIPLFIILNKSVEIFFETDNRVMPSKLYSRGNALGLWEFFDPSPSEFAKKVWNVSAGARSAFLLPKVSDATAHIRLKRDYGITSYQPKTLLDQNNVFAELAKYNSRKDGWYCDVLFFDSKWMTHKENNLNYIKLHKYWLEEAWKQSYNCRYEMNYSVIREIFAKEINRRKLKPSPYLISTIQHLMAIGAGIFPGFIPAYDEAAIPLSLIQEAYLRSYLLKQMPIVMQPHHLTTSNKPVYYSLSFPTLLEYAPYSKTPRSIMVDMRELKVLMDVLLSFTHSDGVHYEFFHSDIDQFGDIKSASQMLKEDKNLRFYSEKYDQLKFPDNSPFFHGCIRVSLKK